MVTHAVSDKKEVEIEALASFREILDLRQKKGVSAEQFKAARLGLGIYSQRQQGRYMVRTKIAAGGLTPATMVTLADAADKYASGIVHLTTRQDAQFYEVTDENLYSMIETLQKGDVITLGAGGNTVRNINVCDHGGLEREETINTTPLAKAVSSWFLGRKESSGLPRKIKIIFCGSPEGCGASLIDDIAFIAAAGSDEPGFSVYIGGGQGAMPRLAKKLVDFVPADDVHLVILAILRVFNKRGSRINRNRARLKFLIEKIGLEKFREFYQTEFAAIDKEPLEVDKSSLDVNSKSWGVSLLIRPPTGDVTSNQFRALAKLFEKQTAANFQITKSGDLLVENIDLAHADKLHRAISEAGLDIAPPGARFDVWSCNGATTCNEGITNSKGLAARLEERYAKASGAFKLRISVSGCPNACGHHHTADIGLQGSAKKIGDRLVPHYLIYLGGTVKGEGGFGIPIIKVPAKQVMLAVEHTVTLLEADRKAGESVRDTVTRLGAEWFERELMAYTTLKPYREKSDSYLDWDSDKEFSLEEVGPGECAGAALDIIDAYFNQARHDISHARKAEDSKSALAFAYDSVLKSAKALLVTYGIDPESDDEAFREFDSRLITRGFVPEEFRVVLGLGDKTDSKAIKERISLSERFIEECLAAYTRINAKANVEDEGRDEEKLEKLDLTGVACPFNYIKVKLALEGKVAGARLAVLLDDGSPIVNVPKSLKNDGHLIVSQEPVNGQYLLLVEKG